MVMSILGEKKKIKISRIVNKHGEKEESVIWEIHGCQGYRTNGNI